MKTKNLLTTIIFSVFGNRELFCFTETFKESSFFKPVPVTSKKVRFALRHHGTTDPVTGKTNCSCPNCNIPSCPCPLGICLTLGLANSDSSLSTYELQLQNELGSADLSLIDNNQLMFEFHQATGYSNGLGYLIVEFISNYTLPSNLAQSLNKNTVTILQGVYQVHFDNSTNGYIVVNCNSN